MHILYLDLENTIIDHWDNFIYFENNIEKIKALVDARQVQKIGIFSYALWCKENKDKFITERFQYIKNRYFPELDLAYIPTVPDMMEASKRCNPHAYDLTLNEYWKYFHKEHALLDYVKVHHRKDGYVGLVDDTIATNYRAQFEYCAIEFLTP